MATVQDAQYQISDEQDGAPDVSVIIPVYNCERYLWKTLDSVFGQELHPSKLEIIAVDDGSTDASLALLRSMENKHSNMIVLSIPNSGSASAPRNAGLDIATGRYVFFLDADDRLEPDALKQAVETGDMTGSGVVLLKMGAEGSGKRGVPVPTRAFTMDRFGEDFIDARAFTTLGPTKLFRRSIVEEHNLRFPVGYLVGEDQPFVMGAYLQSPHISVIRDKVYYWVQERADGTNATSQAQPPHKQLLKNLNLIDTILNSTETGERLNALLERPVVGTTGLCLAFGKRFADSFDHANRASAIDEAMRRLEPIWNTQLRSLGTVEPQVLLDFVVRGDVEAVTEASRMITDTGVLPLEFERATSDFAYRSSSGATVRSLNVKMAARLDTAEYSVNGLEVTGQVGVVGARTKPDEVRLVWKHRKSGDEKAVPMRIVNQHSQRHDDGAQVGAASSMDLFTSRGLWDAFIEADWAELRLRERWGKDKSSSISTEPALVGNPATTAIIYTRHGNLTIDAGPTEKYSPETSVLASPKVVGQFAVTKNEVVIVEGILTDVDEVIVKTSTSSRQANFHNLTDHSLAIVLPCSRKASEDFEILLINPSGESTAVVRCDTRG